MPFIIDTGNGPEKVSASNAEQILQQCYPSYSPERIETILERVKKGDHPSISVPESLIKYESPQFGKKKENGRIKLNVPTKRKRGKNESIL